MAATYAAAGTGNATTDTLIIQAAINGLPNNGGDVYLSPGSSYTVNRLFVRSRMRLFFQGASVTLANSINNNVFQNYNIAPGNTAIEFHDGTINGNAGNQTDLTNPCHGIALYNTTNIVIQNMTIDGVEMDGMYIGGTVGSTINGAVIGGACSDLAITACTITNCRRNAISITNCQRFAITYITATGNSAGVPDNASYKAGTIDLEPNDAADYCHDGEVAYCNVTANHAQGIMTQGSSHKARINIHHNTVNQAGDQAICVFTPVDVWEASDNIINTTNANGIWVNGQGSDITNVTANRNTIVGNDGANTVGIGFVDVATGTMNANHCTDYAKAALVSSSDTIAVTNNAWTSCAVAVDVTGGSTNVSQSGNTTN